MEENKRLSGLLGPAESTRILRALHRGASRRDVLAMLTAAGMHAALAGSIASVAASAHAQTPRKGGRIKVAGSTAAVNDTLDPARQSNGTDYVRGFMFYNGLTYLDGTLTPQPQLAEEFTTTDAKTWIFKLRRGVTFHDGKSLTPQDVIFSLIRHKNPATASRAKPLADQIEEVTASGPNEVTIRLAAPNADLPVILGTYHFHIVKDGTTDFAAGIGTGPYKVREFKPGTRVVAVRNDDYWKPNRPYLDEIEHVGIAEESARVNGLLAGQLDLVLAVDPRSVSRVTASSEHAIFETKAGPYTDLIMRRDSAPGLSEKDVRDMEPASGPVHRGLYFPDYASLESPRLLCQRLADRASTLGAVFHAAEVRSIGVAGGRPASLHCSDGRELQLDGAAVIIAAGAHSKRLAADVGCDVALDTERGYHVEIANPNITLGRPVLVADGAFVASTMQGRLRLAGTVEIAGLHREPDWRRADRMVDRARTAFPGLRATEWTRWMGLRPSMPNSLPVIGASPLVPRAYVACGHGHLGMTLGAVTGTLIADAILGRDPKLDPSPFAPRKRRSFHPRSMRARRVEAAQSARAAEGF